MMFPHMVSRPRAPADLIGSAEIRRLKILQDKYFKDIPEILPQGNEWKRESAVMKLSERIGKLYTKLCETVKRRKDKFVSDGMLFTVAEIEAAKDIIGVLNKYS